MPKSETERWNRRYLSEDKIKTAHSLLKDLIHLIPRQGLALDLAAGEGQNADFLQKLGLKVIGLDFSIIALRKARKKNPDIKTAVLDLDYFHIPSGRFDIILNFYYLNRGLFPQIIQGLKPGGILFFETFTQDMHRIKPSIRPEHLLKKNELREAFQELDILQYAEIRVVKSLGNVKYIAQLIGKKKE